MTLAAVFTASALLRPLIPPPDPNPVASLPGGFMAQAALQRIHWRTLQDQPFAEARRYDKPVVAVVGTVWNQTGRYFDRSVLGDSEVAERLNREFVPLRIDSTIHPEWAQGPFPLAFAASGVDPGWYVVVLRPDGRPLAWLARSRPDQKFDFVSFQTLLTAAQNGNTPAGTSVSADLEAEMRSERELLTGSANVDGADLRFYVSSLLEGAKTPYGFMVNGLARLGPWEWRFLQAAGFSDDVASGMKRVATSTLIDWKYGGFFRTAQGLSGGQRYDKVAVENADMVAALSGIAARGQDPFLTAVFPRVWDGVLAQFWDGEKSWSCSWADPFVLSRNPWYSVRPSQTTNPSVGFLRDRLGINPSTNPSMVVRIVDPVDFVSRASSYDEAFKELRKGSSGNGPELSGEGSTETVCTLFARLSEAARLMGDRQRQQQIACLLPSVWQCLAGTDVVIHRQNPDILETPFLGDYAAFADAMLSQYLATGDERALGSGRAVLSRALSLFDSGTDGTWLAIPRERRLAGASWTGLPSVVDGARESIEGQTVRLLQAYSCVLRDTDVGETFKLAAQKAVGRYAGLSKTIRFGLGSILLATVETSRDQYCVVTGPGAVGVAAKLNAAAPSAMVFPALGGVRKDLQAKGDGVYLCSSRGVQGPMKVEEALAALASTP